MRPLPKNYSKADFIQLFLEHRTNEAVAKALGWGSATVKRFKKSLGITASDYPDNRLGKSTWNTGTANVFKCKECNKEFLAPVSKNRKFCSAACAGISFSRTYKGKFLGKNNPNFGNGQALKRSWKAGAFIGRKISRLSYTKSNITLYRGIYFRSRWEAEFAKQLDEEGHTWDYESVCFGLSNGLSYIPDFYVQELDKFFEVKGYWWPKAKNKFDLFCSEYNYVNIEIVGEEWWKQRIENSKELSQLKSD